MSPPPVDVEFLSTRPTFFRPFRIDFLFDTFQSFNRINEYGYNTMMAINGMSKFIVRVVACNTGLKTCTQIRISGAEGAIIDTKPSSFIEVILSLWYRPSTLLTLEHSGLVRTITLVRASTGT